MGLHITLPPALALPGDQGQHHAFLSSVIPPSLANVHAEPHDLVAKASEQEVTLRHR